METKDHLFFDYLITRTLWDMILKWIGFMRPIGTWQHEVDWVTSWAKREQEKVLPHDVVSLPLGSLLFKEKGL